MAENFNAALRDLEAANLDAFRERLQREPRLANQHDPKGNTLANLAVSLAPGAAFLEALQSAGADWNTANVHGWTPLHQAAYKNDVSTIETLLRWGARPDFEARGAGGTPLVVALFWGHREAATFLSRVSLSPNNLRVAAGLGRIDLVDACFTEEGELLPHAIAQRDFYRPHGGFPEWTPRAERQEVMDEALVWAAKSGSVEVFEKLISSGANPNADPYRGTPLAWAAYCNRAEAIRRLAALGANVNLQATFGGVTHGQGITALHLAAQNGHLESAKTLIEVGANPAIREDHYNSDALGAAKHFGRETVVAYLESR
jgi:ankyrin repeat protein